MSPGAVVAGAAGALALAVGGVVWYVSANEADAPVAAAATLSTAVVEQTDVVTYNETTATLGFTDSVTVTSPAAGTVTSIASAGDELVAGDVVATVDGSPVVAMIGDVPGWRDLSTSSSDGIDIRQLETNLVALGYRPHRRHRDRRGVRHRHQGRRQPLEDGTRTRRRRHGRPRSRHLRARRTAGRQCLDRRRRGDERRRCTPRGPDDQPHRAGRGECR